MSDRFVTDRTGNVWRCFDEGGRVGGGGFVRPDDPRSEPTVVMLRCESGDQVTALAVPLGWESLSDAELERRLNEELAAAAQRMRERVSGDADEWPEDVDPDRYFAP